MNEVLEANRAYEMDAQDLLTAMPDKSIDAIITDPPYGLYGKANVQRPDTGGAYNRVNEDWDKTVPLDWMNQVQAKLKPGGSVIVFGGGCESIHLIAYRGLMLGWRIVNDIIWNKPDATPNFSGRLMTETTESALWFCPDATGWTYNLAEAKQMNRNQNLRNIWKFGQTRGIRLHPTQKPLELMERCILLFTNAGDLVVDPFCGAGTTGAAAVKLNRKFIGSDNGIDKKTGRSWASLSNERIALPYTERMFEV